MNKFLRMTSLVATVAGLAIATPAVAVTAVDDADATVEILQGLTLDASQDLDLGTVVLSGAGAWTATVSISNAGVVDCDGGSGNVTCSGTTRQEARYDLTGSAGYDVDIDSGPVTLSNGTDNLILTPLHDDIVTLDVNGEYDLGVGGEISVSNTTPDGVYTGTFAITAEYD